MWNFEEKWQQETESRQDADYTCGHAAQRTLSVHGDKNKPCDNFEYFQDLQFQRFIGRVFQPVEGAADRMCMNGCVERLTSKT